MQKGDKVKILPTSRWYGTSESNPMCEGTINEFYSTYSVQVSWDNGTTNSYVEADLEIISSQYEIY